MKIFAVVVIIFIVCSAGAFACYSVGEYFDSRGSDIEINGFEECVNAVNSAISSNPIRCVDFSGNVFVKD